MVGKCNGQRLMGRSRRGTASLGPVGGFRRRQPPLRSFIPAAFRAVDRARVTRSPDLCRRGVRTDSLAKRIISFYHGIVIYTLAILYIQIVQCHPVYKV